MTSFPHEIVAVTTPNSDDQCPSQVSKKKLRSDMKLTITLSSNIANKNDTIYIKVMYETAGSLAEDKTVVANPFKLKGGFDTYHEGTIKTNVKDIVLGRKYFEAYGDSGKCTEPLACSWEKLADGSFKFANGLVHFELVEKC